MDPDTPTIDPIAPSSAESTHELRAQLVLERVRIRRVLSEMEKQATEMSRSAELPKTGAALRACVQTLQLRAEVHQRLESEWLSRRTSAADVLSELRRRLESEHSAQARVLRAYASAINGLSPGALLAALGTRLAETFRKDLETSLEIA